MLNDVRGFRRYLNTFSHVRDEQKRIMADINGIAQWLSELEAMAAQLPPNSQAAGLCNAVKARKQAYMQRLEAIEAEISAMDRAIQLLEPLPRAIMRARAIDGHSWVRIAFHHNFSQRHVQRLYTQALDAVLDSLK